MEIDLEVIQPFIDAYVDAESIETDALAYGGLVTFAAGVDCEGLYGVVENNIISSGGAMLRHGCALYRRRGREEQAALIERMWGLFERIHPWGPMEDNTGDEQDDAIIDQVSERWFELAADDDPDAWGVELGLIPPPA